MNSYYNFYTTQLYDDFTKKKITVCGSYVNDDSILCENPERENDYLLQRAQNYYRLYVVQYKDLCEYENENKKKKKSEENNPKITLKSISGGAVEMEKEKKSEKRQFRTERNQI